MKKTLLFLSFFLLFHHFATAQRRNGILAIARYADSSTRPTLDESDGLPEFEGGIAAFKAVFKLEFTFPPASLESEKGGEGIIGFTIDTLGNIFSIEVIDSISPEIDAEAVSVLAAMRHFRPIWKPMKLAILYRAYPTLYKNERYQQQLDSLTKSRKLSEWLQFTNPKSLFPVLSAHVGTTIPTDALNRYLRPMVQLGLQFDVFKNRWGGGILGTIRGSKIRKDFYHDGYYWDKDTTVASYGLGVFVAYRLVEEDRLSFTPFVGFAANFLVLPSGENEHTPTITSFLPTIGGSVDIHRKRKVENDWGTIRLNVSSIRLHFGVNFANFKADRYGNLVDFGVGLSWYSRELLNK